MSDFLSPPDEAAVTAAFSEKRWVWLMDEEEGYIAGHIVSEPGADTETDEEVDVELEGGEKRRVALSQTERMNPPKFDKAEDMADLGYLNEASVVHNLRLRYFSDLIYTYSGLFLVAINPYKYLPIYTEETIRSYGNYKRGEMPPHIYAISDTAYHDMLQHRENQSILITGESGAGKTENTKKVIQYLTTIASDSVLGSGPKEKSALERQILQANPILEAFGNAQTIRNHNSSRFGKFIRIEFGSGGSISGGNIEWYLLEKSRVTHQQPQERNYHIFYQLLKGASPEMRKQLVLEGEIKDYAYTKDSMESIDGVDDIKSFEELQEALEIMGINKEEQMGYFRILSGILWLGNIELTKDRSDQAQMPDAAAAEKLCHVLGLPVTEFIKGLLRPTMRAGRDWVTRGQSLGQARYAGEALARALYERMFGVLVTHINHGVTTISATALPKKSFIGVLDIAGFEIFESNSLEQLLINYTNERLQQFFNHHMFILEQEEYRQEGIPWSFIDFGLDLAPTIDLIERNRPMGILACLDEESVMPRGSDLTFQEKLDAVWKGGSSEGSNRYETLRFRSGFILRHYASRVEYDTQGWLDKNKDPVNDDLARLMTTSTDPMVRSLFPDYARGNGRGEESEAAGGTPRGRARGGTFRTAGQRHKEQLGALMAQLHSTEPHFVRCILPNGNKRPGKLNVPMVLNQLRCNGVLEGIRITRAGFPSRLTFYDLRQRYEILVGGGGYVDGKVSASLLLRALGIDEGGYRVGKSRVFFRTEPPNSRISSKSCKASVVVIWGGEATVGLKSKTKRFACCKNMLKFMPTLGFGPGGGFTAVYDPSFL
ncbi:P-loop containing nucleoside triphosphate hydrolase protein [Piptocephalis cylindrospora]|uniref:P-loop containing nucleoside triphosphate hydrolase protein n=1 Tax=Piptocephalis cylindrospora TaxID=1907219 RepID=A0A4V1IY59_9FUNG|nr:P-loop containing nucleoside triphosphate hydrolase protein [Piptocephalis cylindrospora]|eukprot:RKP13419.1 P-loop containing nucleoside triphosphate hydrolase protein [Piptocephalis cylindrospora]